MYAHVPDVLGDDGKKLSKRHGASSVDEFRAAGYIPEALMNFLALLGWAPDGETTIMSPEELVERFSLERVGASPATLDYAKLDWMNGVYLRDLPVEEYAGRLVTWLREQGLRLARGESPRGGPARAGEDRATERVPCLRRVSLPATSSPTQRLLDGTILGAAAAALEPTEPWTAEAIEASLKRLCDDLGQKPRQVFQPIRVAVTGSKISPGLYECSSCSGGTRRSSASVGRAR